MTLAAGIFSLRAQTISPMAVVSGGGSSDAGAPAYMSYTLGQAFVEGGTGQYLTDGFQQTWKTAVQNEKVAVFLTSTSVVQPGTAVTFGSTLNIADTVAVRWLFEGQDYVDSSNTTDLAPSKTFTKPGTYTVTLKVQDVAGTWQTSAPVTVKVLGITQADTTVCQGQKVQLTTNAGGLQVMWENGSALSSYTITANATKYHKLTIFDGNNVYKDSMEVSIFNPVNLGADLTLCQNETKVLAPAGFKRLFWNDNNTNQPSFIASGEGTITVEALDNNGCTTFDTLVLNPVKPVPVSGLAKSAAICNGAATWLVAAGGTSFKWADEFSTISSTSDSLEVSAAGDYYVTVTGTNGCKTIDTAVVQAYSLPKVKAHASDSTICQGDSIV